MPTYPQPGTGLSTAGLNKSAGFASPPDKGINHTAGLRKSGLDTAGYPVVGAVASAGVTGTTATINWQTATAAPLGIVRYSTNQNPLNSLNKNETGTPPLTNHTVALTGLTVGTTYYYLVEQPASAGGLVTRSNTYSFKTAASGMAASGMQQGAPGELQNTTTVTESQDLMAGATGATGAAPGSSEPNAFDLTLLQVVGISDVEATVQWRTEVYADGTVQYRQSDGTSGPDVVVEEGGAKRLNHSVILSGLKPDTVYRVAVVSADASGALAHGGPISFSTEPAA